MQHHDDDAPRKHRDDMEDTAGDNNGARGGHDDDGGLPVSKTQRKKQMIDLQVLGQRLTELSNKQLDSLDLPENLLEAARDARSITQHGARRRHMQYIGRLMRLVDAEPIREKLQEWDGVSRDATAEQHQLERWRMRLMDDEAALAEFIAWQQNTGRSLDTQHLHTLVRNAREERDRGKAPRYFRELFRELKRIAGQERGSSDQ